MFKKISSMVFVTLLTLSLSVSAATIEQDLGECEAYHSYHALLSTMSRFSKDAQFSLDVVEKIQARMLGDKYVHLSKDFEAVYSPAYKSYEKSKKAANDLLMLGLEMSNYALINLMKKQYKGKCRKLGYPLEQNSES